MSELEKQNTVKSENQVSDNITFLGKDGGAPRIMFVGNSITKHGVKADIGWLGDWGMAASDKEKDYVHIVIASVVEKYPDASFCIVQAAVWERSYKDFNYDETFLSARSFNPDVIICGISENVPADEFEKEAFAESLNNLHTYLKGKRDDCVIIQGSNFFPNEEKNAGIKLYADRYGANYVKLFDISMDEQNLAKGLFEHKGVQIHPGDKGMKMIADRYIEVLRKVL